MHASWNLYNLNTWVGMCVCVCIKLSDLCVSRQTGRRFNNCTLRSVMDLSGMSGLSENHKKLIAAHCVSGFNLPPLLISQHWLLSRYPICERRLLMCVHENLLVVGGSACIDTNSCHRCVGMRGSARRWGHRAYGSDFKRGSVVGELLVLTWLRMTKRPGGFVSSIMGNQ